MSDTELTHDVWHNPCCLALLEMDDKPVTWACDVCGADWRYDARLGTYGPGYGEYWQHKTAQETASMLRSIDRGITRLEKNMGRKQHVAITERPRLSRWQHLKAALRP